jgi:hypothetical protein
MLRKLFPPSNCISEPSKSYFLNCLSTSLSLNTANSLCLYLVMCLDSSQFFLHFFTMAFHIHNHFLLDMPLLLSFLIFPSDKIRSHIRIVNFNKFVFNFSLDSSFVHICVFFPFLQISVYHFR